MTGIDAGIGGKLRGDVVGRGMLDVLELTRN